MKNKILYIILCFISYTNCQSQSSSLNWEEITSSFIEDYESLDLRYFRIDYVDNLNLIRSRDSILTQEQIFTKWADKLKTIDVKQLNKSNQLDFELMNYEIQMHQLRISLEKEWLTIKPDTIPTTGTSDLPFGKKWYRYILKKWVDASVSPEQMFEFGKQEIARVENSIKALQSKTGLDSLAFQKHINNPDFFYQTHDEVQAAYEEMRDIVAKNLSQNFPFLELVPQVNIQENTRPVIVPTPAFYRSSEGTFFYNRFDKPYNRRQIGWIYIHEAAPGHHYQIAIAKGLALSEIQQMFRYSGYREGWAAYVEEIGYNIGAYRDIYDELGKWEWDIIRSVRVVLDVGLNYYGWTDEEALLYWQEHISGQDDIALREINRMTKWPAQVITYKFGADTILKWRKHMEEKSNFNLKKFHRSLLEHGDVPFSILEQFVFDKK